MGRNKCEKYRNIESKHIKSRYVCSKNIKTQQLEAKNIYLNGADIECLIGRPGIINSPINYDCMDCDGNPIKPDMIDQDIWDFLECNRKEYQKQLELDYLDGRENIRCIQKAYNCPAPCPPDCPIPEDCNITECPFFDHETNQCQGVPLPSECIPDYYECDLFVENKLYKTQTVPFYFKVDNPCGGVNEEGFSYATSRFLTNMSYNLDIKNITCNLATRIGSILVHYAYKDSGVNESNPIENNCPKCDGDESEDGIVCLCEPSEDIVCGVVRLNCRQFGPTININIGEGWGDIITIPSDIIQAMIKSTPLPINNENIIGAFQLCIFLEDGLEVASNFTPRGGGGGKSGSSTGPVVTHTGCFNGEAKIVMANGELKEAKFVKVGDLVRTPSGKADTIICKFVQKKGYKELVKIDDLLISQPHRIKYRGKWVKPIEVPGSKLIETDIPVYNFITENSKSIIVNDFIASTIGQFCEGSHDKEKINHQLWGSDKIVKLFKCHPQWPNIELENNDKFLNALKNKNFISWFLDVEKNNTNMISSKNQLRKILNRI